ncbi:MAG: hypothetical protein LBQ22_00570 [Bacteroidales bacterium]|jgi:hypothetical protein|nr:hypothetical protein [Bacteroidales bacterium]
MKKLLLKLITLVTIFLIYWSGITAQNISFFNDYLGNVLVFDNGNIKQIEHQPLKSYKIGNSTFAYEDNAEFFKIYHNHYVHRVMTSVGEYKMSNNLVVFTFNNILRAFDNGNIINLSNNITDYYLGEDVIVWFDDIQKKLKAYYNKEIIDLDDALATGAANKVYIGKNIVAYVDSRNYLNIFYRGEIIPADFAERIKSLEIGKDIVAFVEEPVNNLQVFYKGEILDIENFEPASYKAGDGFLAYVDANNYLKVFSDFNVEIISFDSPDFYEVVDQLMIFGVQDFFKVYYKGKVFTLENYIPGSYLLQNNVIAYIDQLGNLKYFDGTKVETISYETISEYELNGNILKYKFGVSSENIYFNGRTYKND